MDQRLLLLGYFSLLLSVSSASVAEEFKLYDPGVSPNIKMNCEATHHAKGSSLNSRSFKLHLEIFIEERYAVLSDGNAMNDFRMDLTGVVPTEKNRQEYLVLSRGSATAVINTEHHDFTMVDVASKQGEDYSISGRNCRSHQPSQEVSRLTLGV